MEKWYLFNVYTFCKSLYVINVGSPYGLHGDPIYISYLNDQTWLVGSLFVKQLKSGRMNPNSSKWRESGESAVLVLDARSNMTSKYATNHFIIMPVLQMRRLWNLCRRIRWYMPPRPNTEETCSNNSGWYTLLIKSHVTWNYLLLFIGAGQSQSSTIIK